MKPEQKETFRERIARSDIPIEAVAAYPLPGTAVPEKFAFSPDNRWLTYLFSAEGSLTQQLYAFDPETCRPRVVVDARDLGATEEKLSLQEKLRRERTRQRGLGVTQYAWAKRTERILIPLGGGLYIQDGLDGELRELVRGEDGPLQDAQFSPDGRWVAYVRDAELYVVPAEGGRPRQLTSGARGTGKTHGLAEYIAQEEMDRGHGYWWSADSSFIAFTEVDETHIPVYRILHLGKDEVGETAQEDHRYPFAGQANARVRLGVVPVTGGDVVWMPLGEDEDLYLARVNWLPDGGLTAQLENREQTDLKLVRFEPDTGNRRVLLTETSSVWINLHDLFRPLKRIGWERGGGFIWASERTGFRHLYLYDNQGQLIRPLTQGEWMVESIAGVDEHNQVVYFTGTKDGPLECHLYAVSFEGEEPRRITTQPGTHAVVVDRSLTRFVDTFQSVDTPPRVSLRSLADGAVLCEVFTGADSRIAQFKLAPPELIRFENQDEIELYGAVYRPPKRYGSGPFPVIVSVYGGPHNQMVSNSWRMTSSMRAQYLSGLGFLVFVLDNRGSARRGLNFEGFIKNRLGDFEVRDQVEGIKWLVDRGLADPERVGIYGWSYGGFMAAMCLMRAPETFKVAVAGAPVAAWDGYDTHYIERYMGTPQSNPQGYRESSLIYSAGQMEGKLLLIHGLVDENVHFRHTARLINALIRERKPYDLMLFPDERHLPRKLEDRVFMEERIRDYFLENLAPEDVPEKS